MTDSPTDDSAYIKGLGVDSQWQGNRGRMFSTDSSHSESEELPQYKAAAASTLVEHVSLLDVFSQPNVVRNTGIICTIGPASNSVETLTKLIENGMCIARMNFSHGSHEYHAQTIANVREAVKKVVNKSVAVALDTKGPEIRTGLLKGGGSAEVKLVTGDVLKISIEDEQKENGDNKTIYVDYMNIVKILVPGDIIFIDDGLISVKVTEIFPTHLTTVVQNGGMLGSRKGVNLPGKKVDLPALSEKDKKDLKFGVEQNVDVVYASFIRKASDVSDIRKELGDAGKHILIVSKIENEEGVKNFDEILKESDGIMVARGDLGIEIPPSKVFIAQKMMIGRCNKAGKSVIVATQMLESMVNKPRPTRAEASDVANAVLDGADCVMLSGETAKGKYPVEAVTIMSKICLEAEAAMFHNNMFDELRSLASKPTPTVQTIAIASVDASFQQNAAAIITLTTTGTTAYTISQFRPRCPIIAVTRDERTARVCHMYRGVHPLLYKEPRQGDWTDDVEKRFIAGIEIGKKGGYIGKGSSIIMVSGWRPGPHHINTIRIFVVGE